MVLPDTNMLTNIHRNPKFCNILPKLCDKRIKKSEAPDSFAETGLPTDFYSYGYCSYFNSEKNITSS